MTDASDILHFIQPFDGSQPELSVVDKMNAATGFELFAEELALQYLSRAHVAPAGEDMRQISTLAIQLGGIAVDGSRWSMTIESNETTELPAEFDGIIVAPYSLRLARVTPKGFATNPPIFMRYDLNPNKEEITRYDIKRRSVALDRMQAQERKAATIEEFVDYAKRLFQDKDEADKLERQLGINDQPVGPLEIQGLKTFFENLR